MLDESIHDPHDAARACKLGAADILNIKLMKCGGLYPAGQINAIAAANGVTCMVGCMIETRLAITAGLSLAAARQNITDADCDSFTYYDDSRTSVTGGFTFEGDLFRLSEAPGFGVEVDF
jgi:L-alanine-DL-glutamate epimerase-like enolase superfamily enzyme